jgi:formylglycine-generating enzyme required for sulfatase activity/tRNA A-37 threonylcarbamoyl transferase component Bud32
MKPLAPNTLLQNRYLVVQLIGKGGMGEVYLAVDQRLGSAVALKRMSFSDDEALATAFEREARTLARLRHAVLPKVSDHFIENENQYLVMEHISGDDLSKRLEATQKPFPLSWVLFWADQLLDALAYLHGHEPPIIHRDIKPQNLKLTSRGKIKLLDFGIAKGKDAPAEATITNQTFVAATLNYSPLEQILRVLDPTFQEVITQRFDEKSRKVLNHAADAQSDLYALGATVYHLLTNRLPIDALKRALETWAGKPDPLQHPTDINSEVPREIGDWILKAMELEHDHRFASAVEMHNALQSSLEGEKTREEENKKAQWAAEQQKIEQERRSMEEERRRIAETQRLNSEEQKRLLEESEAKRRFAEQQAAAAEKRLTDSQGRDELNATIAAFPAGTAAAAEQPPTVFAAGSAAGQPPPSPFNQTIAEPKPSDTARELPKQTFTTETPTVMSQGRYSTDQTITGTPPKKSSKLLWLIPVLGLLFLIVGGSFGAWMLFRSPATDEPAGNTTIVNNAPANTNKPASKTTPPDGMIYVEGAEFTMGADNADKADVAEMPAHTATVKSFFIDKFEVTREDYAKCVDAGSCTAPALWKGGKFADGTAKFPVVGVNYKQASDYAKWADKRLPTEEEWEFAARGTDKRVFPWGKTWESGKANANGASKEFSEVGKFAGTSPFGVYDMVGNAWEWTSSEFKAYPNGSLPPNLLKGELRVIRGGSYESSPEYASVTYRSGWPAQGAQTYATTGFRCVKDIEP